MIKQQIQAEAVIEKVRGAFAEVIRGDGTSLYASTQLDDYVLLEEIVETKESARIDPGTNWEEIPSSWLTHFGANGGFHFINAKGFRYYLPACMTLYVKASPDEAGAWIYESLIYHLCDRRPSPETKERFSILTINQREAVNCFLAYARSWYYDGIEYGTDEVNVGLNGFWKHYTGDTI